MFSGEPTMASIMHRELEGLKALYTLFILTVCSPTDSLPPQYPAPPVTQQTQGRTPLLHLVELQLLHAVTEEHEWLWDNPMLLANCYL